MHYPYSGIPFAEGNPREYPGGPWSAGVVGTRGGRRRRAEQPDSYLYRVTELSTAADRVARSAAGDVLCHRKSAAWPHGNNGAAGVEVAQQVLAETQGAVLPLVPYLDTLRWLFIAVALGGIAVAIYARLDDWKRGRR